MSNPEKLNTFDKNRGQFNPYGLTCELWTPDLMPRADRHNEIELNYLPKGSISYLFHDRKVVIPSKKLVIFWGLIPHQIIQFESVEPYYVCTIPLAQFLIWNLPASFIDEILKGRVVIEATDQFSMHDEFMIKNWLNDINSNNGFELISLEMRARLLRLSAGMKLEKDSLLLPTQGLGLVEQIAIYIAQNYSRPLNVLEIGKEVGLHPDYANSIFRKVFGYTLHEYIIHERIAHAQRKLVLSDLSITEIAFDCGFNSINRFNAAFYKINACRPREYRKKYSDLVV